MDRCMLIRDIYAREILDSSGEPALEVKVLAGENTVGKVQIASIEGRYGAAELRDGGTRYGGRGVEQAADNVNIHISDMLIGRNIFDQNEIDKILTGADETPDMHRVGANAVLGVSLACARTAAAALQIPLYRYLGGTQATKLPIPMITLISAGEHRENQTDMKSFMIVPSEKYPFREQLRMGAEIYKALREELKSRDQNASTGEDGGLVPDIADTREALRIIRLAGEKAGYWSGKDFTFSLDADASSLYDSNESIYRFPGEERMRKRHTGRNTDEMIKFYEELISEFPVSSIVDPFSCEDWEGWIKLTELAGSRLTLIGGELFCTSFPRLEKGIACGAANSVLIKTGQAGTLTETFRTVKTAADAGYKTVMSCCRGDTADDFIADIAVAFHMDLIRTGAPSRYERVAKYNRLLRIEEQLGY